MLLPADLAHLTMMRNPEAGKVGPEVFEDFQIIPGRKRKAVLGPAGYREGFLFLTQSYN